MKIFMIFFIVACTIIFSITLSAEERITLSFFESPDQSLPFKWAELAYTEAFRRLGIDFNYEVHPPLRSSILSDSGMIDGEAARIGSYGNEHPNLVRVEEPVVTEKVLAVVIDPAIRIENWDSLRGSSFRVEYYRGIAISAEKLTGLVDSGFLTTASNPVNALRKLYARRIDVYVDMSIRILLLLASPEFRDLNFRIASELETVKSYIFLHKRHSALAPRLADVLRQMKAEGLFEKYLKEATGG